MNQAKKKVLIVDDDKLLSEALNRLFLGAGYETYMLGEGSGVEKVVTTWMPDVILLDIMLPGKNGVEITKDLCSVYPGICDRIMVMTTLNDSDSLAKALELGVTSYVQKNTATPQYVFDVAMRIMNK
jgi:CheY-like chemotaxis protein